MSDSPIGSDVVQLPPGTFARDASGRYIGPSPIAHVLDAVARERARQEALRASGKFSWTCSDPLVSDAHKLAVLAEEFGEVSRAIVEQLIDVTRRDVPALRAELVQVAAVAVAWCEALDAEVTR